MTRSDFDLGLERSLCQWKDGEAVAGDQAKPTTPAGCRREGIPLGRRKETKRWGWAWERKREEESGTSSRFPVQD